MQIPLIVHYNTVNKLSPNVFLPAGEWVIKSNHTDKLAQLEYSNNTFSLVDGMNVVSKGEMFRIHFLGNINELVTISAELQ